MSRSLNLEPAPEGGPRIRRVLTRADLSRVDRL
jgi:hypothetical protein